MHKKQFNYRIIAVVLVILLCFSYIAYQIVLASKSKLETQFALKETVYNTIETKGFVVRDEKFIRNNVEGTTVSFAKNGERIASGDTVSVVFKSVDDATSYLKISELEKKVKHYEDLSGQANFQTLDIDSLTRKIDTELVDFLQKRDKRDFKKSVVSADVFRDSVTTKQIATGGNIDFSKKLADLKNELSDLKSENYTYTEVKGDSAGYYINGSDGYESTVDFNKINELKVEDVERALKAKPLGVPSDVAGRVVSSFRWYIICAVDTPKTINITYDKEIFINLPFRGIEKLPVKVHKIGERDGDKTMIILSCDLMNESLADLRIEDIQIVTQEYTGYKIPNCAIRTVDGVKGVYVVRGNLLGFRKIHILYSTKGYSIVNNPEGDSDYIKLYDKVVTKGVELYDNKLI